MTERSSVLVAEVPLTWLLKGVTSIPWSAKALQYDHGFSASYDKVPSRTLDSLLAERTSSPVLVKIDVEGAEALVLRGAERLLAEHRPTVLIEVHKASAGRASLDVLTRADYRSSRVGVNRRLAPVPPDLAYGHVVARPSTS